MDSLLREKSISTEQARTPLVTVVIPCYNHARFLPEAVRSVHAQRYSRVELIVVDDGSTDESGRLASALGARVLRQHNLGTGAARNAGLAFASGEYVIFLDADDELLPDAIVSGVTTLADRPDLSCVVRRCRVMDVDRRALPVGKADVHTTNLYREWLLHNFVWTPGAAIFRRERIAAIGGFPPDVSPAADYAVYLRLSRSGEVAFHPEDVVRYRQHDSNMSRDPLLMLEATLTVLDRERAHLPPEYAADFQRGLRNWREYYGEQIVDRLRRESRAGTNRNWRVRAVLALIRHCPQVLFTHAARKLTRVARGLPPSAIEPGRFDRG
jgi:glycosyltransferase involved in cell wall biosynthesis